MEYFLSITVLFFITIIAISLGVYVFIIHKKHIRDLLKEKNNSKAKSEFVSIAAHQLRAPLSGMKWILKAMIDEEPGAVNNEQRDYLQKGYAANERMIALVNDILDVTKIEGGKLGFEFYLADFLDITGQIVNSFQILARKKHIRLRFEKPDTLDQVRIDPARITLVLQNLIDNAIKYTPTNGKVTVRVEEKDDDIQVSVHDTGIGISQDQVKSLFTRFFRAKNAVKTGIEGTGLGLFIAKNIITKHGGSIWVEENNESKNGSIFIFLIPKNLPQKK